MINRITANIFCMAILVSTTAWASDDTKVEFCELCTTDSHFAQAGEVAALSRFPILVEGSQQVLVMNTNTRAMRMVTVVRESISTSDGFGGEFWSTTSQVGAPDSTLRNEAIQVLDTVDQYWADIQNENAWELDFGPIVIDSATDLLGEGDGPDQIRGTFSNALDQHMTDSWADRRWWDAISYLNRLGSKYLGETIVDGAINVTFEDGTEITVEIEKILQASDGDLTLILKVLEGTAKGPGIPLIPTTPGGFAVTFPNPFSGDLAFLQNLADLFVRGGGRLIVSDTGTTCSDGTVVCVENGFDDNGNPLTECTLVRPKAELNC